MQTKNIVSLFLSLGTVAFLVGCGSSTKINNNINSVVSNANTINPNVTNSTRTNTVVVNNDNSNDNVSQVSDGIVDTSDWQTYTNEGYGFNLKYPRDWTIDESHEKNISISIISFNDMPDTVEPAPNSQVSPITKGDNELERTALQKGEQSHFNGKVETINNLSFIKYVGYIEGGSLKTEYVTFQDNTKISIQYAEGDNVDFVKALEAASRTELLTQYQNKKIQNSVLSERNDIFEKSVSTFQFQ